MNRMDMTMNKIQLLVGEDHAHDVSYMRDLADRILVKYFPDGNIACGIYDDAGNEIPEKVRAAATYHLLVDGATYLELSENHDWDPEEEVFVEKEGAKGVTLSVVREDGTVMFVEPNLKKFPVAPLRAVLTKHKGKMLCGNLGDQKFCYFRFRPHNDSLPEKILEVNLWQEEIEDVLERCSQQAQSYRALH